MLDKFIIQLTWCNCANYRPEKIQQDNLYITDRHRVCQAVYSRERGWYNITDGHYICPDMLKHFWWTNIEQAVRF